MILRLADVLDLPHKDSNLLLHSVGYAAAYTELELGAADMALIREALKLTLDNHNRHLALDVGMEELAHRESFSSRRAA